MQIVVPRTPEENKYLCDWCAKKIGQEEFRNATGLGFADATGIVAVVVLHDLSTPNVFLSWASTTPRFLTRKTIRVVFDWIFNQQKCSRVTGLVEKNNKRARKLDEGLGMKLEGVLRKASPNGRDLFVYGLLREEAEQLIKKIYATSTKTTRRVQPVQNAQSGTESATV